MQGEVVDPFRRTVKVVIEVQVENLVVRVIYCKT
jgi:hypothetical protein